MRRSASLPSRQLDEPVTDWLARILQAIPDKTAIDCHSLDTLVYEVNGPLGDEQRHIGENPEAHLAFWRTMAERLSSCPLARAAYADSLLLTGHINLARQEMLAAFKDNPMLIYRMSGEYRDIMKQAGGRQWAIYRALTIKAAEMDDPELNRSYIDEELKLLTADIKDNAELQREVFHILKQ